MRGLKCRLCGKAYPKEPLNFCTDDFGPLEVDYDYDAIREVDQSRQDRAAPVQHVALSRTAAASTASRPSAARSAARRWSGPTAWPRRWASRSSGSRTTPSTSRRSRSRTASSRWRCRKAGEFGFTTVGCASTGNLANSVAANAAAAGLRSLHLRPQRSGAGQDPRHQRLRRQGHRRAAAPTTRSIASARRSPFKYGWGFVNINLRPFYAEGSKTMGFEIAEQLGWRMPQHVVAPMAGGSLIGKIHKAFKELHKVGLIDDPHVQDLRRPGDRLQPDHRRWSRTGREAHRPVRKPNTIAKSLAIGDPADGYFASQGDPRDRRLGRGRRRRCEIVEAMTLLAQTEGIWAETAGGVTLAVTRKADRAGPDSARRGDRHLHHRQRPEDAGRRRRPGGEAGRHPPEHRRVRRGARRRARSRCWCKSAIAGLAFSLTPRRTSHPQGVDRICQTKESLMSSQSPNPASDAATRRRPGERRSDGHHR